MGYAVLTLFFAVMKSSAKSRDSRNGLRFRELHEIIRRSQLTGPEFTLLITLLLETRQSRAHLEKRGRGSRTLTKPIPYRERY